jgi:hypothetical protein
VHNRFLWFTPAAWCHDSLKSEISFPDRFGTFSAPVRDLAEQRCPRRIIRWKDHRPQRHRPLEDDAASAARVAAR